MLLKRAAVALLVIGVLVLLARVTGTFDSPPEHSEAECKCVVSGGAASAGPIPPLPGDRDTTFDGVTY